MKSIFLIILMVMLSGVSSAKGAVKIIKTPEKKTNQFHPYGVFIGGRSQMAAGLQALRVGAGDPSTLRMVLDLVDRQGKLLKGRASYFHARLTEDGQNLVLDLEKITQSNVNHLSLKRLQQKVRLIKQAQIFFDPVDQTTSLSFQFQQPVDIEVFSPADESKPAQIIIDVRMRSRQKKEG